MTTDGSSSLKSLVTEAVETWLVAVAVVSSTWTCFGGVLSKWVLGFPALGVCIDELDCKGAEPSGVGNGVHVVVMGGYVSG